MTQIISTPAGPTSLLDRAGGNTAALATAMETAIRNPPQVSGSAQPVRPGRDLVTLQRAADKEASKRGDQFIASEMFLRTGISNARASPEDWAATYQDGMPAGCLRQQDRGGVAHSHRRATPPGLVWP